VNGCVTGTKCLTDVVDGENNSYGALINICIPESECGVEIDGYTSVCVDFSNRRRLQETLDFEFCDTNADCSADNVCANANDGENGVES